MAGKLQGTLCVLALCLAAGTSVAAGPPNQVKVARQQPGMRAPRSPLQHVMGAVAAKGQGFYIVRGTEPMTPTAHILVGPDTHFFFLKPAPLSAIRSGWQAHAIGEAMAGSLQARMIVLFPGRSRSGVPPPSSGMSGIGTVVQTHPLVLQTPRGERIRVVVTTATGVRVAEPMPFSALRIGDHAMTFGNPTNSGLHATIVHVRREATTMRSHGQMR